MFTIKYINLKNKITYSHQISGVKEKWEYLVTMLRESRPIVVHFIWKHIVSVARSQLRMEFEQRCEDEMQTKLATELDNIDDKKRNKILKHLLCDDVQEILLNPYIDLAEKDAECAKEWSQYAVDIMGSTLLKLEKENQEYNSILNEVIRTLDELNSDQTDTNMFEASNNGADVYRLENCLLKVEQHCKMVQELRIENTERTKVNDKLKKLNEQLNSKKVQLEKEIDKLRSEGKKKDLEIAKLSQNSADIMSEFKDIIKSQRSQIEKQNFNFQYQQSQLEKQRHQIEAQDRIIEEHKLNVKWQSEQLKKERAFLIQHNSMPQGDEPRVPLLAKRKGNGDDKV